jgi:hypothetical protein
VSADMHLDAFHEWRDPNVLKSSDVQVWMVRALLPSNDI